MAVPGFASPSSVGIKLVTGVTGLGLVAFVTLHLVGNLTFFLGPSAFNEYARFLEHLGHGWVIVLAEMGLIGFFAFHIAAGLRVWLHRRRARSARYAVTRDAGGPSRKTVASRSMVASGLFLFVYVVLHVAHFKFGPEYTTVVHGEEMRDLYRLVVEEFKQPVVVISYVGGMLFLGLHLRHGVWSMMQSLGALNGRLVPIAFGAAVVVATALAIGFIGLPLYVFAFVVPAATSATPGGLP